MDKEIEANSPLPKPSANLPPLTTEKVGKTVKVRKKKLEKIRMDNNATAIQKVWRGKQERKQIQERKDGNSMNSLTSQKRIDGPQQEEEKEAQPDVKHQREEKDDGPGNDTNSSIQPSLIPSILPSKTEASAEKSEIKSARDPVTSPLPQTQDPPPSPVWPATSHDDFGALDALGSWPNLESTDDVAHREWVMKNQKLLVRVITWNMCANDPPPKEEVQNALLPLNKSVNHNYFLLTDSCS
jgi:hypothetical protein